MAQKIYAIGHPHGFVKIGRSVEPRKRIEAFQPGTPYKLWIISVIEVIHDIDDPIISVENGLHNYFEHHNVKREWFDLPEEEIESLGKLEKLRVSEMKKILYDQVARSYCENPDDPYLGNGERGVYLYDHVREARLGEARRVS